MANRYRLLSQREAANAAAGWLPQTKLTGAAKVAAEGITVSGATEYKKLDGWNRIEVTADAVFGADCKVWQGHVTVPNDGATTVDAGTVFWGPYTAIHLVSGTIIASGIPNDQR